MNSYAMIITANDEDDAFKKSSKAAERYGDYNVSSIINYCEEPKLFKSTAIKMIEMYQRLIEANKNLIEKFEDKVPEDDFILNQMKDNLIRFEKGLYKFPDEWKIVFFDGNDFKHVDSTEFFEQLLKQHKAKDLYMLLIDTP
jgi:hypothetical protein